MDKKDKEFCEELLKRIDHLTAEERTASSQREARAIVRCAVDSMIKDGIIGPAFHVEVETKVTLDKDNGKMNISFNKIAYPNKDGGWL
jgi:hypothetical protein